MWLVQDAGDPVLVAQDLIRGMDTEQLQRVREVIYARMYELEPLPAYWHRYPVPTERVALRRWRQDCIENDWSKESAEALTVANSLGPGFVEAFPNTIAEMDLPIPGQWR